MECEDWVVVQGVSSELVSNGIPCYAGKIQGIFANMGRLGPLGTTETTDFFGCFPQIPYAKEQGI